MTRKQSLVGRRIAITGGARGIGLATARELHTRGAHVAIGDLDLDLAKQAAASIAPEVVALGLDVSQESSFADFLRDVKDELGGLITKVQGTGLLFSCELAEGFKGYGTGSTEEWMRERGIGVIHGGANSLRFTPRFATQSDELDLLVSMVKRALKEGPRDMQAKAA